MLSSSAKDESSFTEQVINDINKSKDGNQKIYRFAVYRARRHLMRFEGRWFKVAHGLKNMEPFILSGYYDEHGKPVKSETAHEDPPKGAQTELIPIEYYEDFRRRCRTNLQSLSGISSGGSYRLFSSMVDVEKAIEMGEAGGLKNPRLGASQAGVDHGELIASSEMIPLSEEDDKQIWDFLDHKTFLTRRASQVGPLRHETSPRFCHIDLATQSQAGLSICHPVGQQLVEGLVKDGQPFSEYRTVIEYDFILSIVAGQSKPISFEKIQKFLFWLRDVCRFRFAMITADTFQSVMPLQMLENRGFKVKILSLDRNKTPYYQWRNGFEEGRIRMYRQQQLLRETEELVDGREKIDHTNTGSKDISDSAAGAYFSSITSDETASVSSMYQNPSLFGDGSMEGEVEKPPIEFRPEKPVFKEMTFNA